jgi:hypothetical protein
MALLSSSGLTSTPSSQVQTGTGAAAQPYAADVLAKGSALINNPAPAYTGQLTAGTSDIQNKAWQGLSNLTLPSNLTTAGGNLLDIGNKSQNVSYNPVGGAFDAQSAGQYMNPYLSAALDPQLKELQRQAQIANVNDASRLTQGGAYGGGRQAVLMGEQNRNLLDKTNQLVSHGYNTAYDKATTQFNADQARKIQEAQYGTDVGLKGLSQATSANQAAANAGAQEAQYGLQNLQALGTAGNTQQAQNQAGLNALYNQYLDQRTQPFTNLANQSNLIKGLGGETRSTYNAQQSDLQKAAGVTGLVKTLTDNMTASGMSPSAIANAIKGLGIRPTQTNPATGLPTGTGFGSDDIGQYTTDSLGNTYKLMDDGTMSFYRPAETPLSTEDEALYANLFNQTSSDQDVYSAYDSDQY